MMMKSGMYIYDFFYFEIELDPSEILMPSATMSARKSELTWPVSSNSEGARSISKLNNFRPLFTIILKPKMVISRSEILVYL